MQCACVCMPQVCEVSAESQVRYELETRFQQLQSRLASVTLETEEVSQLHSQPPVQYSTVESHVCSTFHTFVLRGVTLCDWLPQVSKTLKATLTSLLDTMCDSESNPAPDLTSSLSHELPGVGTAFKITLAKRRANQQETESYYFTVMQRFCFAGIWQLGFFFFFAFYYLLFLFCLKTTWSVDCK